MVCSKNFFRLLTKGVKTIYSTIFPKCVVVLRRECAYKKGSKFHILTNFTIHFTLSLIFIRIWTKEDLPFGTRQIARIIYIFIYIYIYLYLYIFMYIHDKQSDQISQKQDEHNTYVIMKTMCPPGHQVAL